jgi:hypothetical protein
MTSTPDIVLSHTREDQAMARRVWEDPPHGPRA